MSDIYFYKGKEEVLSKTKSAGEDLNESDQIKKIQDAFSKVLDGKNLSFLLGCGCSSFVKEIDTVQTDVGVPTMMPLAKEFYTDILSADDKLWLNATLKLDIDKDGFKNNLEKFLGTLHSIYFFYETTGQEKDVEAVKVAEIIKQARNFLLKKCLNETNRNSKADKDLIELYKSFSHLSKTFAFGHRSLDLARVS